MRTAAYVTRMESRTSAPRPLALITGASSGIGLELARVFARNQFDLLLVARRRDTLEGVAGKLEGRFGISANVYAADLSISEAPQQIFDFTQNEGIAVEVLVNNAGFGVGGAFSETDLNRELDEIQVNITALTHLTKLFLPQMIKRRSGRILQVASTAGFQPGPLMSVYYATKAYVVSFSQALSEELRHSGVSVTALCPGSTHSEFAKAAGLTQIRLFQMGGIAKASDVAEYGYDALMKRKRLAIPGLKNKFTTQVNRIMPRIVITKAARLLQEGR